MPKNRDLDTLYDVEFFAGRAGVEPGYALARLQAAGGDKETIALVESARSRATRSKDEATALINRIRDRQRKQQRRKTR
ncbi:MAG TPA: hypothetical protein ENO16_06970 [Chromatiales bacterium]|nr:hypothetical protein [Chromatiales bacterium]